MNRERRPVRVLIRAGERILNLMVIVLILIMVLYSAYSIWYTHSLTSGAFISDELAMFKPTGTEPTLYDLMKINPDVRGWLTIDNTNIDYPFVQGEDDWAYLNRDAAGEFSLAGAVFLSASNDPDMTDPYNMLYGHHVSGGAMFSDVLEFRTASWFDEHRHGILWLPDKAFRVDIFAVINVDAADEIIYQDPGRAEPSALPGIIESICSRAVQAREIPVSEDDIIIGMSTCENAESFERVVLFGKLIPMSLSEIEKAEQTNYEEQETAIRERSLPERIRDVFRNNPWILPVICAVVIGIVIILIVRAVRKRDDG